MRETEYLDLWLYEFPYFNKRWVEALHKNFELIDSSCSALNDAVNELEERLTTAEGEIDTLQTKLTAAEGEIDTLQTQLATANETISTLNQNYTALEARVAKLEGGGA